MCVWQWCVLCREVGSAFYATILRLGYTTPRTPTPILLYHTLNLLRRLVRLVMQYHGILRHDLYSSSADSHSYCTKHLRIAYSSYPIPYYTILCPIPDSYPSYSCSNTT